MKFIADITLGKLTKWLRILGYDTVFYRGGIDQSFFETAKAEGRVALTRKQKLGQRRLPAPVLVISHDRVADQIKEVVEKLDLSGKTGQWFTRCINCNRELTVVRREEAAAYVPAYVLENYDVFQVCLSCKRVFWPGTHKENMQRFLMTHTPFHPL